MEQSSEAAVVKSIEELAVGMKVEAMDRYGKWCVYVRAHSRTMREQHPVHLVVCSACMGIRASFRLYSSIS